MFKIRMPNYKTSFEVSIVNNNLIFADKNKYLKEGFFEVSP